MDLRITLREDCGFTILQLHGSLGHETVPELSHVIAPLRGPWRLDLTELRSVDHDGVEMLTRLRDGGVSFVGMSPYIALCLGLAQGGA